MTQKNYQVTIGYKAIICVNVKAESEDAARKKGVEIFGNAKDKVYSKQGIELQDDNYKSYGILNMDETWNML